MDVKNTLLGRALRIYKRYEQAGGVDRRYSEFNDSGSAGYVIEPFRVPGRRRI